MGVDGLTTQKLRPRAANLNIFGFFAKDLACSGFLIQIHPISCFTFSESSLRYYSIAKVWDPAIREIKICFLFLAGFRNVVILIRFGLFRFTNI
jgi:hypothetical protein